MPLYEYECSKCNRRFEVLQKFSDDPVALCVHCGGEVSRLISSPAIQFKGTGWYVTDYARKSDSASPSKGDGKGAEGGEKSSPAQETKPSNKTSKTSADSSDTDHRIH